MQAATSAAGGLCHRSVHTRVDRAGCAKLITGPTAPDSGAQAPAALAQRLRAAALACLGEVVTLAALSLMGPRCVRDGQRTVERFVGLLRPAVTIGLVILVCAVVFVEAHEAVVAVVCRSGGVRPVDGQLGVVDAEAVP